MTRYTSRKEDVPEEARVIDERIEDLEPFVSKYSRLPNRPNYHEIQRLQAQLRAMRAYSAALHDRMEAWKTEAEDAAAEAAKHAPRFDP